jgi:hypothetical protein
MLWARVCGKSCQVLAGTIRVLNSIHYTKSSWENGYNELFNGKLRDELLNGEIFTILLEAKGQIEQSK